MASLARDGVRLWMQTESPTAGQPAPRVLSLTLRLDTEFLMEFSDVDFEPFLLDLERVLIAAARVTGDAEAAKLFVASDSIPPLGHKTAATLVAEGRVKDVLAYMASIESGFVG